jgi:crossover junction endodeoxyribonuclease RuvC
MIIGIDPGGSGALVALDADGYIIDTLLMPTIKVGTKTGINAAAVAAWVKGLTENSSIKWRAVIELVNAMPSGPPGAKRAMGTGSAFSFGKAAGMVEGVIVGAMIPLTYATPQAWKKHAGLIGSDKDAARSRAIQLYPSCRILDQKGKGQAVADAILIARYGLFRESGG